MRPALTLDDDGTLAIYDATGTAVWETFPAPPEPPLDLDGSDSSSSGQSASGLSPQDGESPDIVCTPFQGWPHYSSHAAAQQRNRVNVVAYMKCEGFEDGEPIGQIAPGSAAFAFSLTYDGTFAGYKYVPVSNPGPNPSAQFDVPCQTGQWQSTVTFNITAPPGNYNPSTAQNTHSGQLVDITACRRGVPPVPINT